PAPRFPSEGLLRSPVAASARVASVPGPGSCDTRRMDALLPTVIVVLGAIALISFLAQRVAIPAPVMLAVAGMVWSLVPWLPALEISPHVVLSVFLPPLLYADAWEASWVDFRRWLRPILQLAVGLVAFTIAVVGVVAHQLIPGL